MKTLLWFLFGVLVAIGGQALAGSIYSTDDKGNISSGTYNPRTGNYSVLGNQGLSTGKAPALQAPQPYRYQNPC